jgi:hypothetical protein
VSAIREGTPCCVDPLPEEDEQETLPSVVLLEQDELLDPGSPGVAGPVLHTTTTLALSPAETPGVPGIEGIDGRSGLSTASEGVV